MAILIGIGVIIGILIISYLIGLTCNIFSYEYIPTYNVSDTIVRGVIAIAYIIMFGGVLAFLYIIVYIIGRITMAIFNITL